MTEVEKPYSAACERNREPILAVLQGLLAPCRRVLEIGSGTGQHAVHFAAAMPHLVWQTSDRPEYHAGISQWLGEAALPNALPPLTLDVKGPWPQQRYDAVFTANTLHIMGWDEVQALFTALPAVLADDALLVVYGPFRMGGAHTSESNLAFDTDLKSRGAHMGIRDLEAIDVLAARAGLGRQQNLALPANNRCVVWRREAQGLRVLGNDAASLAASRASVSNM